jgi:hypothetical protein
MSKCKCCSLLGILSRHKDSSWLHFGHKWPSHTECANGILRLCNTFFECGFILRHGTYWWSSSLGKRPSYFGHFIFIYSSLTFLSHTDNTSSFFLPVSFGRFRQVSYTNMWGHYGSNIMKVFSGHLSETSSSITNIFSDTGLFFMEDCAPSIFLMNWVLMVPY